MNINIKRWSEVPEEQLADLFIRNPFPNYRGTPLCGDLMKRYMFMLANESSIDNGKNALVACMEGKPVATGQIYHVPYLSDFWGMSIGGLGHIVVDNPVNEKTHQIALFLISELLDSARQERMAFISVTIPAASISFIQALEKNGFLYAEGFLNMTGPTNKLREQFMVPALIIREPRDSDFLEIEDAYSKVSFPSRFVTDAGFNPQRAFMLYVNRFREVYKKNIGKIFIAELEDKFAGAIIAIIDDLMAKSINVKTNILSGMGIIIHPRAYRRGVSLALIDYRQDYYLTQGVEYVNFGANFNNLPMISGLTKLGLKYSSLEMTFHRWLK